jgi:hypothetical protein
MKYPVEKAIFESMVFNLRVYIHPDDYLCLSVATLKLKGKL